MVIFKMHKLLSPDNDMDPMQRTEFTFNSAKTMNVIIEGTVSDKKHLKITLEIKKNTF